MKMVKFGAKPKTHTFEEFKQAVLEYQKKKGENHSTKTPQKRKRY